MDSENEKISLLSNLKFSSFEKLSENFLKAKCYVLALGKNVNKSHFSKENVDRAYPSLAYAPVIGHLMVDDNGVYHLGGHDYHLDMNDLKMGTFDMIFLILMIASRFFSNEAFFLSSR